MDRVGSGQRQRLGELAGLACELAVDPHQHEFALKGLELLSCPAVRVGSQEIGAMGRGERRAALGVTEDAGRHPKLRAPQLGGHLGAGLDDDELQKRGGVEVEDQRRCSVTSSDTGAPARTCARRGLRGRAGGVMRPRLTRSASGSSASTADSRAIGCPGG